MPPIIKSPYFANKSNLPTIWVVTTFNMHGYTQQQLDRQEYSHIDNRSFGWFPSEDLAVDAVQYNRGDIFEYYYNYALIEEVAAGIHGATISEIWFKWDIPAGKAAPEGAWKNIDKPKWSKNIFGWSLG